MTESTNDFDGQGAVDDYRRVMARRDEEKTSLGKAEFDVIARRMRAAWKEVHGDDDLHKMAFGEPAEKR
jgi:hypothetical protein